MDDRRNKPRFALGLACTIRTRGGVARRAQLIDISETGCRIEITSQLNRQELVWLGIAPVRSICGSVAWSSSDFAGIQFAEPLHASVVDQMVAQADRSKDQRQAMEGLAYRSERLAHWTISTHEADCLFKLASDCRSLPDQAAA